MNRPTLASLIVLIAAVGCEGDDESPGAGGSSGKGGTAGGATGGTGASGGKAGTGGTGGGTGGSGGSSGSGGSGGSSASGGGGGSGGSEDASAGTGGSGGSAGAEDASAGSGGSAGASATGGAAGSGGAVGASGAAGTGGTSGTAGASGAAGSSTCAAATCGTAPHQFFNIQPFIVPSVEAGTPPDVTFTASICNTTVVVPNGTQGQMCVQKDVPFYFTATQTGYLTALTNEYEISLSFPDFPLLAAPWMFPPSIPLTYDPAWDPAQKAFIRTFVGRSKSGSTAPCDTRAGVTFAVTGHPEAVVAYGGGGTSTGSSASDATGYISIVTTGTLAAPEFVTVTATESGCTLSRDPTASLIYTLRSPVARGVATTDWGWEVGN
jgi:hypothetical protein